MEAPVSRVDHRILGACALVMTLGGCADSFRRADFITDHTGDSHAANKAIHIVDPWPPESFDTRLPGDGARGAQAVTVYRNPGAPGAAARPAPSAATQ
jgi:hypothetical protein